MPAYTDKQGQYLAFIYYYTLVNGQPPAEADMQRFFHVTPPTVHQMVLTLAERGLITLLVEKVLPPEPGQQYPLCVKGRGACPPEDVGGVWGYIKFLKAIQNPDHPEHERYLEWIGGEFNPEEFDLEETNAILRRLGW